MTPKEKKFFSNALWYHGTTLNEWRSICESKILSNFNIGYSLDFGNGFYLSPNKEDTKKYALDTVKYNGNIFPEDNIPVVLVFDYLPINDINKGYAYKYFGSYNEEFATFVFECRKNYLYEKTHSFDITGGVMTDSIPTVVMQNYFSNQISKEQVLEQFMKSTSKKQLCLHTQELCDKLKLVRAFIVNGKELDVNEYKK